ncbi:MAG TPA: ribosome recycling factor [Candidatus Saccharimonadales bacterium]|nr:ribosome recycling factor [Candidatus Saccharimonadales bacterium]
MDPVATQTKQKLEKVLDVLKDDLATIRTGKAAPSLVENIVVSAYGGSAKLKVMELATIGATDNQTLVITPFDVSIISDLQKGIEAASAGLNPINDGTVLRIVIPPLSLERRQELIKAMKHKLENGKVMVRQVRHEMIEDMKKDYDGREDDIKRLEKEVQKLVDESIATIDDWGKQKEQELLQI